MCAKMTKHIKDCYSLRTFCEKCVCDSESELAPLALLQIIIYKKYIYIYNSNKKKR